MDSVHRIFQNTIIEVIMIITTAIALMDISK